MSSEPMRAHEGEVEVAIDRPTEHVAIRVSSVSKCYEIYARPQDRLKQSILPRLQRLTGRQALHYYKQFWALNDISFEVRKGDSVGIIGRNGSGKSTLLQIICGTLAPSAGHVETSGRIAALLELGSGFNPEFTGRENVFLSGVLLGLSQQEIEARFDDIAAFADIGEFIEQPVKQYSSGMYFRLAFAVIAHVKADILVIDEALAVGDAFFTQKCMRFLRKFMETNTLLFVSHDAGAVNNLCNRAIWIEAGRLLDQGAPKAVTEKYLEAFFEAQHGKSSSTKIKPEYLPSETRQREDQRAKYFRDSNLRNDIEVFQFDPAAEGFGAGGASIIDVTIRDGDGTPLSWVVGGELVRVSIWVKSAARFESTIVGFFVKDRFGQILFGDNTFLSFRDHPVAMEDGDILVAEFDFRMPRLAQGDYSISAAVASGTQNAHVQQHWIHDALVFKSGGNVGVTGIVGLPMERISLIRQPAAG